MILYCLDCGKPICFICSSHGDHKGHNTAVLSELVSDEKIKLQRKASLCDEEFVKVGNCCQELCAVETVLKNNGGLAEAKLGDSFEALHAAIRAKHDELVCEIRAHVSDRLHNLGEPMLLAAESLAEAPLVQRHTAHVISVAPESARFMAMVKPTNDRVDEAMVRASAAAAIDIPSNEVEFVMSADYAAILTSVASLSIGITNYDIIDGNYGNGSDGELIVTTAVTLESGRLYQYRSLTIRAGGSITVGAWDGQRGGVLRLMVAGSMTIEQGGSITLTGRGYRGGVSMNANGGTSNQGESPVGVGAASTAVNGGGGGGGLSRNAYGSVGGGGGGYGTRGADAEPNRYVGGNHPGGVGGNVYENQRDVRIVEDLGNMGSGGGGGSGVDGGAQGGVGGSGGGNIIVNAMIFDNNGVINNDGNAGSSSVVGNYGSGGGGGSGGSIMVTAGELKAYGTITAVGGAGGNAGPNNGYPGICSNGGQGGDGRIRIIVQQPVAPNVSNALVSPRPV